SSSLDDVIRIPSPFFRTQGCASFYLLSPAFTAGIVVYLGDLPTYVGAELSKSALVVIEVEAHWFSLLILFLTNPWKK
ncbi:hypothetical protein, partial [Pseudomonas viridiflava]|uniref:hypothetical protein n=1 Tax=Pseudomonas viridiflava TaxID=33069 RepID=UPI0019CFDEE0